MAASQSIPVMEGSISNNPSPHINMLHMKLIHHFEVFTAETLVLDTNLWRNEVMHLSFQVLSPRLSYCLSL
jgi:hypothetical protein